MHFTTTLLPTLALFTLTNAHGYFTTPPARQPGPAYQQSCGMQAYYQMSGDINGNIQGLTQTTKNQPDYNPSTCRLWKCKGLKYADNTAHVQKYSPGQVVPMVFDIRAPHTGSANVSIIDITTLDGTVIASNLKKWDVYASTASSIPSDEENFSITMPTTLGSRCAGPGKCAIQLFWDAPSVEQTYESCVDFEMAAAGKRHARDFGVGRGLKD
ncbi:hypothetical protein LTR62_000015 [Meristemomyces frigidus]|uniref:Chitin-binding type-4 domain-containing protein n=1 Tax=Meristemomyces frigidus TaxID=1508187 RepID=A0AAN7TXC7_9PEZI|nr:hypothetical protein LTR62_000015 [Meristemomyces frigidus]